MGKTQYQFGPDAIVGLRQDTKPFFDQKTGMGTEVPFGKPYLFVTVSLRDDLSPSESVKRAIHEAKHALIDFERHYFQDEDT